MGKIIVPQFFMILSVSVLVKCSPHCMLKEAVSKRNNSRSQCPDGYFVLMDEDFKLRSAPNVRIKSERQAKELNYQVLCCPGDPHIRLKDPNMFFWPNQKYLMSKGIFECHPTVVPGLDSIRFYLYRNGQDPVEVTNMDKVSLSRAGYNRRYPVKLIIHGFMSSPSQGPCKVLASAYSDNVNVICVDWEALANVVTASDSICYNIAASSTKHVGKKTSQFVRFLVTKRLTTLNKVHVLGHSLGAHAAGFTGKFIHAALRQRVNRVTGFDPARPHFDDVSPTERIDYTDANFVDIIHTAIGDWEILGIITFGLIPFPVSIKYPLGHVDFYPNGGSFQPGCSGFTSVWCSHSRSYHYYAESIKESVDSQFLGKKCEYELLRQCSDSDSKTHFTTVLEMGERIKHRNQTHFSVYYLETNAESPYAKDPLIQYKPIDWLIP